MRITAAGRVLIGTPPPTESTFQLDVNGTGRFVNGVNMATTSGNVGIGTASPSRKLSIEAADTWASFKVTGDREYLIGLGTSTAFRIFDVTADTERMRITSGGDIIVGSETIPGAGSSTYGVSLGNSGFITAQRPAATVGYFGRSNSGELFAFYNNTTQVGNISITASITSYNVTSDYRLKEDLKQFNGLEIVNAIKVYNYKWKSENLRMDGVLAHELAEVLPYAVFGKKDELDEYGNNRMQSVDYSKIVPVMIKAIQELNDKIK
jgi:hypothetical protein